MIRRPPKSPLFPYTTLSRSLKFSGGVGKANSPLQQLMDIRQVMTANGDGNKKIWATEYGQPASSGGEAKENEYIADRSEEHTSELQSRLHLVCRLLLEKKKK